MEAKLNTPVLRQRDFGIKTVYSSEHVQSNALGQSCNSFGFNHSGRRPWSELNSSTLCNSRYSSILDVDRLVGDYEVPGRKQACQRGFCVRSAVDSIDELIPLWMVRSKAPQIDPMLARPFQEEPQSSCCRLVPLVWKCPCDTPISLKAVRTKANKLGDIAQFGEFVEASVLEVPRSGGRWPLQSYMLVHKIL